jgi:glycosyltransferase involved in cell wall biosynthesis
LLGSKAESWTAVNPPFDRWAARRLRNSRSRIFVGAETCARDCFQVAREQGMVRVLDAPQVHSRFLVNLLQRGHEELGRKFSGQIDDNEIAARKEDELELADWILTYSDVHRRSFIENGIRAERLVEIPLWADAALWDIRHNYDTESTKPLEVLFVGSIGIRKGIPWLLNSLKELTGNVRLTLLGTTEPGFEDVLAQYEDQFVYVPSQPRTVLNLFYQRADILVLPSLVDSFGFVAMEAMLAGLPVIVSENCGVPVPSPSWRVPIMDGAAIAARLVLYADNRTLLEEHGAVAKAFARQFTPVAYREKVGRWLRTLLT